MTEEDETPPMRERVVNSKVLDPHSKDPKLLEEYTYYSKRTDDILDLDLELDDDEQQNGASVFKWTYENPAVSKLDWDPTGAPRGIGGGKLNDLLRLRKSMENTLRRCQAKQAKDPSFKFNFNRT